MITEPPAESPSAPIEPPAESPSALPALRSVLDWAKAKGTSDFVLAGALVKARWPKGNVYDDQNPLLVTEAEFDAAMTDFSSLKVK